MKSNDGIFSDQGRGKDAFPDLKVKNWYYTTEELIRDTRKRINIRTVVEELNKKMKNERKEFKLNKEKDDKELLQLKLERLKQKYNKR